MKSVKNLCKMRAAHVSAGRGRGRRGGGRRRKERRGAWHDEPRSMAWLSVASQHRRRRSLFFHILLLFFCDSGTAETNTRRGGGRGGKGGSCREEGRHCRASSSAAGSTLRSNKPKGKCNKRENLVRDQPHQGCKGSGSSSSSEGSPGPSLAEIWLAIVGVGRGLS